MTRLATFARFALPLVGALALGACGGGDKEQTYQADATDQSGGDLIVSDADGSGVPVDVPETAMTPVAPDTGTPTGAATESPAAGE